MNRMIEVLLVAVMMSGGTITLSPDALAEGEAQAIFVCGFEEGPTGGWRRNNYGKGTVQFTRETENPHSGEACLMLKSLRWHSGMVATLSPRFRVLKGKKYVLRLWLRTESLAPTRAVVVIVRNSAEQDVVPLPGQVVPKKWSTHARRRCSASAEWQEYILNIVPEYEADVEIQLGYESVGTVWVDDVSVSGRLPRSANNGVLVRIMGSGDTFLMDGVQLEEGDLTPFAPGGEVELGSSWHSSVTGVYRPGVRLREAEQPAGGRVSSRRLLR